MLGWFFFLAPSLIRRGDWLLGWFQAPTSCRCPSIEGFQEYYFCIPSKFCHFRAADACFHSANPYFRSSDCHFRATDTYCQAADCHFRDADVYRQTADCHFRDANDYCRAADCHFRAADDYRQKKIQKCSLEMITCRMDLTICI